MKRLRNGRFARQNEGDGNQVNHQEVAIKIAPGRGFFSDLIGIANVLYKIWQLLPYMIVIFLLWKYLKLWSKVANLMIEMSCGEGCLCSCPVYTNPFANTTKVEQKNGF